MENTLTAYNEQVRKFTAAPTPKAKSLKQIRMAMFEACFGGIFEKSFTKARIRVLDEIIFKSAETGIYAAKAETIAANCGLSTKTVTRAVAEIKKSDEYVIAYSATGRKGGYIFIDRKHEKFGEIMVGLFGEEVAAKYNKTELEGEQESNQQNDENAVTTPVEAAKTDEPSFVSDVGIKELNNKPKNLKADSELNIADKSEKRPTAIYVRLSEVLAEMFGKSEMKSVMRKLESMRKNMTISDDVAVQAALETAQSNNCRNFFALWSYKIKVALGIIDPSAKTTAEKAVNVVEAPEWLKQGVHKKRHKTSKNADDYADKQYTILRKLLTEAEVKERMKERYKLVSDEAKAQFSDDKAIDFAAEVAKINAMAGK